VQGGVRLRSVQTASFDSPVFAADLAAESAKRKEAPTIDRRGQLSDRLARFARFDNSSSHAGPCACVRTAIGASTVSNRI
jgi:hypothetical protein